jgi:hypothetical protein
MTKRKRQSDDGRFVTLTFVVEDGEPTLYLADEDGKRIAKRYSGQRWIALEPGYAVYGSEPGSDYGSITVEYTDTNARPQ